MFFKKWFQNRALCKLSNKRAPLILPLEKIKSIVAIVEPTESDINKALEYLIHYFEWSEVSISFLVLNFTKEHAGRFERTDKTNIITGKDLNSYGLPVNFNDFPVIDRDYDLMIDFTRVDKFTNFYLATYINAKFKVGRFLSEDNSPYDFVAKNPDSSPLSYIKQVFRYLNLIRPA